MTVEAGHQAPVPLEGQLVETVTIDLRKNSIHGTIVPKKTTIFERIHPDMVKVGGLVIKGAIPPNLEFQSEAVMGHLKVVMGHPKDSEVVMGHRRVVMGHPEVSGAVMGQLGRDVLQDL